MTPAQILQPKRPYPAAEATRDPIFLLQRRIVLLAHTDGYTCDEHTVRELDDEVVSNDELIRRGHAVEYWETESVFFTRAEGEAWAESHAYRWPDGYRVYCVPAEGELRGVLALHTECLSAGTITVPGD